MDADPVAGDGLGATVAEGVEHDLRAGRQDVCAVHQEAVGHDFERWYSEAGGIDPVAEGFFAAQVCHPRPGGVGIGGAGVDAVTGGSDARRGGVTGIDGQVGDVPIELGGQNAREDGELREHANLAGGEEVGGGEAARFRGAG